MCVLQPYYLPLYTFRLIIYMQHPNTAPWLPTPISRTPRVEEQLPVVFLVVGCVGMSVDDDASMGKFLASYTGTSGAMTQDMDDANSAMPNQNFPFER